MAPERSATRTSKESPGALPAVPEMTGVVSSVAPWSNGEVIRTAGAVVSSGATPAVQSPAARFSRRRSSSSTAESTMSSP